MIQMAGGSIADTCGICGKSIKPGTVFALKRFEYKKGCFGWVFCHLECDARRRGAHKERLRDTSRMA